MQDRDPLNDEPKDETSGVSRRDFLKISTISAAAVPILGTKVVQAAGVPVKVYGPGKVPVELTINAVFGGCEIRVPEAWEVVGYGQGIFGGYVDSTKPRDFQSEALAGTVAGNPRKALILRGVALFGGVEIKN